MKKRQISQGVDQPSEPRVFTVVVEFGEGGDNGHFRAAVEVKAIDEGAARSLGLKRVCEQYGRVTGTWEGKNELNPIYQEIFGQSEPF